MSVSTILGDASDVYRLLFRRSVATAALVYAAIGLIGLVAEQPDGEWPRFLLGLVSFVLGFAGPILVQGALVQIVRNVHDGQRPETVGALFRAAWGRAGSLIWASIVYGVGVTVGLLLLIVPGLLAAARWCLMAPLIMLEDADAREARHASSAMVQGSTATVLGAIIVAFLIITVPALSYAWDTNDVEFALAEFAWSSLTAPFFAHVLTVIYYKISDPDRPVTHPDVKTWGSVWEGR